MTLPTTPTTPVFDMQNLTMMLYGKPKIGKSTFCSAAENTVFLATEPGLNHLEVFKIDINSWEDFRQAYDSLKNDKHTFKTVVIDTVDNLASLCSQHVCDSLGIGHESEDKKFGRSWSMVRTRLTTGLSKLAGLNMGMILTSHSETKEIETRTGTTTLTQPSLRGRLGDSVLAMVDLILYADSDKEGNRILRCNATHNDFVCGDRTGRLPATIPLDYEAFSKALKGGK